MGDPESDEHLRIFKCLVDTGSDVLRYTVERKMLINTSFEQYLNQNKHNFYHQFEKRRYKPCCSGNPHNCVVNGKMDKKIFFKMYNKKAELDTQDCLDRFEVNADISLDKLDLSDCNFFLWNSATLSTQEEQSLQAIMSTRSAICHSSSSRKFSLDELENFWLSLKNDLVLFADSNHYKKSIEREITTLMNCSLSKIESKKVIDKMKKIFHEIKLETEAKKKSMENQMKKGNEGLKDCFRLENNSIKTHINEKVHEILENCEKGSRTMKRFKKRIKAKVQREGMKTRLQSKRNRNFLDTKLSDSERTICKTAKSNKRRMDKMLELTQEEMNQNSKRFKSMQTQQTENNKKHQLTTIECKDEIKAKVKREGRKTRLHNEDQNKSFHQKLTETEIRIDKRVAQSQTQLATKMEEEAHETRRQIETGFKILLGVLGKQNITLGINQEQIEELIESSDARDIYITSKYDQQCLTEDKEKNVIENLQSEIPIPPSNDINSDPPDKQAFQVIVKKVNSIILKLKATPGIFKSVETLKSALLILVKNVHIAGKIDAEIEDTITIDMSFDSPLTKDQIAVVNCLFSKEWNDDNNDKKLSKEYSSSAMAKIESYPEHETSSHQAVTRPLCQACVEKDKQIKSYEEKTRKHEKSIELDKLQGQSEYLKTPTYQSLEEKFKQKAAIEAKVQENQQITEKYKLQGLGSTIHPYNCRNCFEKDDIIIQLDRQLCQIRRHLFQIKENQLEKSVSEGDLVKLITLAADTICADESTRIAEKETKSNIYSLRSDKIRSSYTKTDKQKGLGIILHGYLDYFQESDKRHLQEFFAEIGYVTKCMAGMDYAQLDTYFNDQDFYCTFIVLMGYESHTISDHYFIDKLLHLVHSRRRGKPMIILTDSTIVFPRMRQITDGIEILIVMSLGSRGPYGYYGELNIFDDFLKTTRRNPFADIMDILTRMNALYDYPIITFQSSLRKKFCFL